MAEWLIKNIKADVAAIAKALNVSEVTARIIVNRGLRSYEEAKSFLNPALSLLASPFEITGMAEAVERLLRHIETGSRIAVYGDYDVDGVMSAVILQKCLAELGADYIYYVPDREAEGYGLNAASVAELAQKEVSLIIACDNGISAHEEAGLIYENGMELIIIDHHEPKRGEYGQDVLPKAEAIIDPKINSCRYPFKAMCAAGLCYRFAIALFEASGKELPCPDDLLVFASLATVCDIVDLLGDNRIIVRNGLQKIRSTKNPGLRSLIEIFELDIITAYHFGFLLGPAINASGRLESARTATELFLTDDMDAARVIAAKLYELNKSRRSMTEEAYARLCDVLSRKEEAEQKVYVLYDEETHESVAGIVAGRLKETFHHPVIVVTKSTGCAKGSARSIEGYNIHKALSETSHLFDKFGGHSQAAGFSLPFDNIAPLRRLLNERCGLTNSDFTRKIHIDARLALSDVSLELCDMLEALGPFGKGNREPVFAEKGVVFKRIELVGSKQDVVKLWPSGYPSVSAIIFGGLDEFLLLVGSKAGIKDKTELALVVPIELDIAFSVVKNVYRGESSLQLVLKDFR